MRPVHIHHPVTHRVLVIRKHVYDKYFKGKYDHMYTLIAINWCLKDSPLGFK